MISSLSPTSLPRRRASALVDPGTPSSEPFRTLRLALQLRASAGSSGAVLITSAEPRAGKSTVAANFAAVSSLHQHVLLIDADLRSPSLHSMFGVARSPGLVDLLAEEGDLDDFVTNVPGLGRLDVLTCGRPIPRASDLASSPRMAEMLSVAAERYDAVVIDSPPVLSVADTEGLASHPGIDIVVVAKPATRRGSLVKTMRKLELVEGHVVGLVLNEYGHSRSYGYG